MNRPTKTLMGAKARKAVLAGVNAIYLPVRESIGPEGKSALLYRTYNRGSRITDDGVTIAECQEPKDPHVRLAAQAFKEACKRTVERVGDGTTTTAVIGGRGYNNVYAFLNEGTSEFVAKKAGLNTGVVTLRKKMLETAEKVKQAILEKAVVIGPNDIKDLERVATISVKDAALGKIIAGMAMKVGVDGFIDVVEGYKGEIETQVIEGFRFPAKVGAKAFVNNQARYEMVMQECNVLITNYAVDNAGKIGQMLQKMQANTSKIIFIAPSFSEDVLINMANACKAGYFIYPVKVPSLRTEQFDDLAVYCGADFINKDKGRNLANVSFSQLGFVEKMIVKDTEAREDAVVTGGAGTRSNISTAGTDGAMGMSSAVQERIETLKSQLKETQQEQFKKLLERRIASMSSAVGIIRVGDSTQASALFLKLKIEDGVYACKAALRGGYVKGGGLCLKEIVEELELLDDDVLKSAFLEPYELIQNSVEGGIDITNDVIDPAEAIYYAVEHAVGVIAQLATVGVITPELEQADPAEGYQQMAIAIGEVSIALKQHFGLIRENEIEAERDRMGGMSVEEMVHLDNG